MKRNLWIFLVAAKSLLFTASGQIIKVEAGTTLSIKSGTAFGMDGLLLTPSSDLSLSDLSVSRNTTANHFTLNTYISRVYRFSTTVPTFSGAIEFYYLDGELNGIAEPDLRLNTHNGTSWQAFASNTNDAVSNYVLTNGVSNVQLNELTLANVLTPLPLKWGTVAAYRQNRAVKIEWVTLQENNVNYFEVERSTDGRNWVTVIAGIAARNGSASNKYEEADVEYRPERLYYRIKQVDNDGRIRYSIVATVREEKDMNNLLVYPNPVNTSFYVGNCDPSKIRSVELYNISGSLIKAWSGHQNQFDIKDLPHGLYTVKILMMNESHYQAVIQK